MTDVVIDNRFNKLNAIRLDRLGGAVVRNLTVQQSEFNALYVLETDGFLARPGHRARATTSTASSPSPATTA